MNAFASELYGFGYKVYVGLGLIRGNITSKDGLKSGTLEADGLVKFRNSQDIFNP